MPNLKLARLQDRVFSPGWIGFREPGPVLWTGRRARVFMGLGTQVPECVTGTIVYEAMQEYANGPRPIVDPNLGPPGYDPTLHPALLDLADDINEDVRSACLAAFEGAHFPGIEDGIEPVSDDHVRVVMGAMQRELTRERRSRTGGSCYEPLPGVQLETFPWPVQRALAERRRYRYQQFGITRDVWKSGVWTLTDVPEDPDYIPLRLMRGMPSGNDAKPTEWVVE